MMMGADIHKDAASLSQPVPAKSGSKLPAALSIGLIAVAVLSLAFAGYNLMNPHSTTMTQQQLLTNTQNVLNTQTVTSLTTVTDLVTTTSTSSNAYQYNYYQYCGYYGCYYNGPPGYTFNPPCQQQSDNTYQCSGWIYLDGEGCTDVVIPVTDRFGNQVYEYYALHNLPASYPSNGSWVTVTGQVYQGPNTGPNGASCVNQYINVTSIS